MWRHAGLLRERTGLERAVTRLQEWSAAWQQAADAARDQITDHHARRVRSLTTVGLLIARAALRRLESRGGHFRADFPSHDDVNWKKHVSDVQQRD
jgi:L-aspartate oxidase